MFKKNALISVYNDDKPLAVDFAQKLVELGWQIWASGGTARHLENAGVEVSDVASIIGGEAILGHRVVTLSREVHAGLLARDVQEDRDELERLGIPWFDLLLNTWYPLSEAIKPGAVPGEVWEMVDIGGPTMVKSAAKGGRIVITDPRQCQQVLEWLHDWCPLNEHYRLGLAAEAVNRMLAYYAPLGGFLTGEHDRREAAGEF